jgi:alkylation response protein AidB-like acyl-CoA dehydrogenase
MYSFDPTEEQQMLVQAVGRYGQSDLRPAARQAEEERVLPPKLVSKGWELGLLQASVPEVYGGFGEPSCVTGVLAMEELAHGDVAGAFAVSVPALFTLPIVLAGSDLQKQEYLHRVIEADWRPYSAALIEYRFDFDPSSLQASARSEGETYVLNGEKAFVPFAREAQALMIYADLDGKTQGFIVPNGTAGLSVAENREDLMGLNALPLHRVRLDQVSVPAANRLGGRVGHDFAPILARMQLASAAAAVGLARAALEYSRDYAKEREAFGVKIAQKQAIAFMLAEMATEIEAIRLLAWEAAWKVDVAKDDACSAAYLAATGAADMVLMVTDRAVQILGGHGYIREHPVELWLRNARGFAMLTGLAMV